MRFPPVDHFLTGVAAPVFALRSQYSCGTGDFLDLVELGHWCQRVELDLIQILPINDTGYEASPYNAQSAFALNPLFARLERIPGWEIFKDDIQNARRKYEHSELLEYRHILDFKLSILDRIFKSQENKIRRDPALRKWAEQNPWLKIYTAFLKLRSDVRFKDEVFVRWVQFHLELQLREASTRLEEMGVSLKGDIPILLSGDSADVWANPHLFEMKLRVGAPPDVFSPDGQNWRFPSFRWEEMHKDDFAWWRNRLKQASKFYHAFRIDHVLGFFRVWGIPESERSGAFGYFEPAARIAADALEAAGFSASAIAALARSRVLVDTGDGYAPSWHYGKTSAFAQIPAAKRRELQRLIDRYWTGQEDLWRDRGSRLLRMVEESTDMLVCAEDLGVVPSCVPEVLRELEILSLKVDRWARDRSGYIDPVRYPRLSVSTTSTHDTSTLRGWWEEPGWDRKEYFELLDIPGECPPYLTTEVSARIIERNLSSNSLISIMPLQDLFGLYYNLRMLEPSGERINVPGLTSPLNWSYRMQMSIESLIRYDDYNAYLHSFIRARRNRSLSDGQGMASHITNS